MLSHGSIANMDSNMLLINAVKRVPQLYTPNMSLATREAAWKRVAQQLSINEKMVKARWHCLYDRFKRAHQEQKETRQPNSFRYKKHMEFLIPYVEKTIAKTKSEPDEILPENIIKPEFVITESDLVQETNTERYVFMEVTPLEHHVQVNERPNTVENGAVPAAGHNTEVVQEEHVEEEYLECSPKPSEHEENQFELEQEADKEHTQPVERLPEENSTFQPEPEAMRRQSNEHKRAHSEKRKYVRHCSCKKEFDRNEDDVFGELVAVTLRNMSNERKQAVKKQITSVLFGL